MDKEQFWALEHLLEGVIECDGDREDAVIKINSIFTNALVGENMVYKIDVNNVASANEIAEHYCKRFVEGEFSEGTAIVRIGDIEAEDEMFGIAFTDVFTSTMREMALDQFLAEPTIEKTVDGRKRDGLGSPAPYGRSIGVANY